MTEEISSPTTPMPLATPLLEIHQAAGAEIAEYFGTLLPAHFGDGAAEYQAARETVGVVDSNFRALFSLSGPDAQRYLNAVLTSNVRDLVPEQGAVGLLLNAQGHILAEIETFVLVDRILASTYAMVRERTFATLDKFIIMDDVTLEDITPVTGMIDIVGPLAAELISQVAALSISELPALSFVDAKIAAIPCRIVCRNLFGHPGATIVAAQAYLEELWHHLSLGARALRGMAVGMDAINSIRLECGIKWFGQDYDERNIPHEAGLELSHISYEKGCYTGQEIVERVRSRGHVNRWLTELRFLSDKGPIPGTKLFAKNESAAEVGYVTSVGFSPMLSTAIGIGMVRNEHSTVGTHLDASGMPTEAIAPPSPGKTAP